MSETTALPLYSVLPFAAMLLAIAFASRCGRRIGGSRNRNKLLVVGAPGPAGPRPLPRPASPARCCTWREDYVSFIVLLAGLYVISGGILLRGDLEAHPAHQHRASSRSAPCSPR